MKPARRRGAFVRYQDGEWGIDTKVKIDGAFVHLNKKGYASLTEARADFEKAKAEFIKSRKAVSLADDGTFDDLFGEYESMRRNVVAETTLNGDESILHVDFIPYFGSKSIKDCFTLKNMEKWHAEMVKNHSSKVRQAKAISRMKDLLKYAYTRKRIDAATYQDCDIALYSVKPIRKSAERVVWSIEEEKAFMAAAAADESDYVMFATFFASGTRLGEFLGLQPKCFDGKRGRLTICQQAVSIAGKGTLLTDRLKTKESYRTVALPADTAKLLKDYIEKSGLDENDFIFPVSRTTFRRKLYEYCSKAGVRQINPHASRHMQATRLASVCVNGNEIEAAARRLGHSPEMFMNTYAKHADDATEEALISRLPKAIS